MSDPPQFQTSKIKQMTNGEAEFLNSDDHQNILHISTFPNRLIFIKPNLLCSVFLYNFCFVLYVFFFSNNIYLLFVIW